MNAVRRTVLLILASVAAGCAATEAAERSFREAVEADWRLQDEVRQAGEVKRGPAATTKSDALGGVDGAITGEWGFHTQNEQDPWWQVDLGGVTPLDRVVVYNRCDRCTERNNRIILWLSDDGEDWTEAYQHDGTVFYGHTDGKPLVVKLGGKAGRFVRLGLRAKSYFHLDEVQVYPAAEPKTNIALWKPCDQSSVSQWSVAHKKPSGPAAPSYPFSTVLERGRKLAADLLAEGAPVEEQVERLEAVAERVAALPKDASAERQRTLYFKLRWAVRRLALANPLLNFEGIFFTKRAPSSYSHMSDQYYGWWSRPGGGLFILRDYKTDSPTVSDITPDLPEGSFLRPCLSYDGKRVLFAWCRYYPKLRGKGNKTLKKELPPDANFHVFEMNIDGSGLRQLTHGRYDDFDARYLPDGRIVFLSTRRGQHVQCGTGAAARTLDDPFVPDSYVRCGGGNSRPVAVYTLHVMDREGTNLRAISAFENFEWTLSVTRDGRVMYARWDYVDRHNNAFMSLWATHPDGTMPNLVYANFTRSPQSVFEARCVPGSSKVMFTASAHHSLTGGSICLLDTARGTEGDVPLRRLTPEVCFPETEGWPSTYYAHPWPLAEDYYLVSWSHRPLRKQGGVNDRNDRGIYLADAFGNLELLHRDPDISSCYPMPLRPRPKPQSLPAVAEPQETTEGRMLVVDVYRGLDGVERGTIQRIRVVGTPAKTQPQMNHPRIGLTREDPGKFIIGTAPVEPDGSAHFRLPAGVPVFFQALDKRGRAVQTMRTLTYAQPGQTLSCVGCHEPRRESAPNRRPLAASREPSRLEPGPPGTWPLRFDQLVQPVLDAHCVKCHRPSGEKKAVAKLDLRPAKSYDALLAYGGLQKHIRRHYLLGHSEIRAAASFHSPLLDHLREGHHEVELSAQDLRRLVTWLDTYAQRQGHFSPEQEKELRQLRQRHADLLAARATAASR